jgi:transposase
MCRPDKSVVLKSITFANAGDGWQIWEEKLNRLDAPPSQILIGMEATSRYAENLYHQLEQRGYVLRLLHPGQTHHFHQQRGLRAKTDRLEAMCTGYFGHPFRKLTCCALLNRLPCRGM